MILVLVGPHGAGKTTLGARLAARLGLPFLPELGRELAEDPRWRPAGVTAQDQAEAFDAELFRRELERDRLYVGRPRVVETWHVGNLAYAERRSPELLRRVLPMLRRSICGMPVQVLPIYAAPSVLRARQSEPGDTEFFLRVGLAASAWATRLHLPLLSPLDSSQTPPDALVERALRQLTDPHPQAIGA